ncbi:MAG: diguanylate cyclase [Rhodospirillales bacterium]|nr:MAG: diguanylate cyclase [Rhodospirillales bacterium]
MLEAAGYRCRAEPAGKRLAQAIIAANPNVALVGVADPGGLDVIREVKSDPASRRIPLAAVDVSGDPAVLRACYDAGVDDLFEDDAEDAEILARLVPLIRLSGMEAELLRRAQTAAQFGITVDTSVDVSKPDEAFRLLVVGVARNAFEAICPMLVKTGISYFAEPDPYRARSRLNDEAEGEFAGALVYVGDDDMLEKCSFFIRSVRDDRRLFDLPLFVVTEPGGSNAVAEAYGQGANVVAHMPVDCDFLEVHLKMLHRGRAIRRAIGRRIASALAPTSADRLGSVYSSDFMQAHMKRLEADMAGTGRQSAAILFFVPTIGETAALYGADNAAWLRRQVADWLAGLVRVEDIVARVGSDEFLMLLPETSLDDAARVRRRVVGVLHQSEFGLMDNVPLSIDLYVQSACVTLKSADTLEMLIERASGELA